MTGPIVDVNISSANIYAACVFFHRSYHQIMGLFSQRASSNESIDEILPTPTSISTSTSDVEIYIKETTITPPPPAQWYLSPKNKEGDTALALFSNPEDLHETTSPAQERALQLKIDLMILPYLAVCYAFFFIDKTTLSYAAIFGIKEDLNLKGNEYSWLSSVFYFGFLVWACES